MWATVGVGGGFVALLGLVFGMQNIKINKSVTKELCNERTEDLERRLSRGVIRFDKNDKLLGKLTEKVTDQSLVLAKVLTIVERMDKTSGC